MLLKFYQVLVLQKPWLTVIVISVLSLCMGWIASDFKVGASAESLVLENDKSLAYFREINKRYQSPEFLVITFTPKGELLSGKNLQHLKKLRDALVDLPLSDSVVTLLDAPLLYSPKVSLADISNEIRTVETEGVDLNMARQEFLTSPIYENLILSADGKTTALLINLKRDATYFELLKQRDKYLKVKRERDLTPQEKNKLLEATAGFALYSDQVNTRLGVDIQQVREVMSVHRGDAQLHLGGVPMISADMISYIKSDLKTFGTGILLFIVLTLCVIFRSPRWVIIPLLTCSFVAALSLGYLTWLDWRLTVISSNFIALILIITLQISIHLVVRFREIHRLNPEWSQGEMVLETVRFMAKPCFYTALTTIVAFASLVISGIRPVIDFGWMMVIGIVVALVVAFVFLPAALSLLPKTDPPQGKDRTGGLTLLFARFTDRFGGWIIIVSAVCAVVAGYGITKLEVENKFIDYFHDTTEIYQGMALIDQKLGGTTPFDIILDVNEGQLNVGFAQEGDEDFYADEDDPFAEDDDPFADEDEDSIQVSFWFTRSGLSDIEKLHDFLDSQPEIGRVQSLATAYKVVRDLNNEGLDDFQLAFMRTLLPSSISESLIEPYLSDEHNQTRVSMRVIDTAEGLKRAELIERIHQFLVDEMGYKDSQINFTGMLVLYNNMLQSLFASQILTLGVVFFGILVMFVILFRSLLLAIIALTPNMLTAGIVLGGMGLSGIPLDMMTITIAGISVGIGVDHAIHYIHRFKVEFAEDQNYKAAMYRCHGSIGHAMYYAALTVIIGFSILSLSNFIPSVYFGLLTSFAMFSAMIGALTFLPQLIILLKPYGPEMKQNIVA